MIDTIQIWDFDGTLVDSSHRYRTMLTENGERIDLQYWIDNEHRTLEDSIITENFEIWENGNGQANVFQVIATARIWCELSEMFIQENGINPDSVIARRNRGDVRGGAQLKIAGVNRLLNLKQFQGVTTIEVFEDNAQYLKTICDYYKNQFRVIGHYFPSDQGH